VEAGIEMKLANVVAVGIPCLAVCVALACADDGAVPPLSAADGGRESGTTNPDPGPLPGPDGAVEAGPGTGLSSAFVHRDINHVLGTGQSLSVGATGTPALSRMQPYANLMFNTGVLAGSANLESFVPLVEGPPGGVTGYPNVETLNAAFANLVARMAREELLVGQPEGKTSHDLLLSAHGVGGTPYSGLKKGTAPFTAGIAQVNAAKKVAAELGKSYIVRAVTTVHGESDHVTNNLAYDQSLVEWQRDYETDVKAITGQADPIPLFQTQMSSWTRYGATTSKIPLLQLSAHVANPGKIVLVGPKYHLAYSTDGVHLTNAGYLHMGEDYAKVYRRVILEGRPWEPLRPLTVTRAGAVITVKFAVPAPPLVLDIQTVSDPGTKGFQFASVGATAPAITKVEVTGPDTVTITLAGEPAGTTRTLRYAMTGQPQDLGGPMTGPRGNLRDSEATVSRSGNKLYNWCVHFEVDVP
jgi:hypothetical protein